MGPLIPIIIMVIIVFIIGCIVCKVYFLIIPHFFKNSFLNKMNLNKKESYILKFGFVLSICSAIFIAVSSLWNSDDYWQDSGSFDYFRVPLEMPFQLSMTDDPDEAVLELWSDSNNMVNPNIHGIDSLNKVNKIVFGFSNGNDALDRYKETNNPDEWFILDCETGISEKYSNELLFRKELDLLKVDRSIKLLSTSDYYHRYWDEH